MHQKFNYQFFFQNNAEQKIETDRHSIEKIRMQKSTLDSEKFIIVISSTK